MTAWILKPALLVLAGFAVQLLGRRASVRHFGWVLTFAGLLLLPFLPDLASISVVVPAAVAKSLPQSATEVRGIVISVAGQRGFNWYALLWPAGVLAASCPWLLSFFRVHRLLREASPVASYRDVPVFEHRGIDSPFTFGWLRPVILLPLEAQDWPEERRANVLAHEYAHIDRQDWLIQTLGQAACAMYWFHPLVWLGAAMMRRQSELACDDQVVASAGASPTAYAEDLLELAKQQNSPIAAVPAAVPMWGRSKSQLELRIMRILETQHDRRSLGRTAAILLSAAACVAFLPVASVRLLAQSDTVTLRGVVNDPGGARIPGVKIQAKKQGATSVPTVSESDGSYALELTPGMWTIEAMHPGFAVRSRPFQVEAGTRPFLDMPMALGRISENVRVEGKRPPVAETPRPATPQRIRVGGMVQAANLISKVDPIYPADLQAQGVEGVVELEAVISKTGGVLNVHPRSMLANARLVQSAVDAVRAWQYKPTLLNGEPVEVVTTVTVNFYLK